MKVAHILHHLRSYGKFRHCAHKYHCIKVGAFKCECRHYTHRLIYHISKTCGDIVIVIIKRSLAEIGSGKISRPEMNYPIYFFVRAEKQRDGDEAALAVKAALEHMKNFLAWLKYHHEKELGENKRDGDFARINLDDAFIDITTVGPIGDGWYAELLQIDREEPLNLCITEELYIDEDEDDDDGEE